MNKLKRIWRVVTGVKAKRPDYVVLGEGAWLDPSVRFTPHGSDRVTVGTKSSVWRGGEITPPVTIGDGCFINRDAYIRPHTTIGHRVSIGPFVKLLTDSHELSNVGKRAGRSIYTPIVIEDGVWVGAAAVILGGVTLGRGCVVAAGAVVTRNVAPDTLVAGVPAKVLRTLDPLRDVE